MKVFDLFSKKSEKGTAGKNRNKNDIKALEVYSGMRVIVENSEGRMLFIGKLQDPQRDTAELHQYSDTEVYQESNTDIESSLNSDSVPVKIRGYNDRERKAVFMEGTIIFKQKHIWKIENLTITKVENERSYPRMDTDAEVIITAPDKTNDKEKLCRLLNISVGGASISSGYRYYKGDKFLMKAKLSENRPSFNVYCEVLRVVQKDIGSFEYGCRFVELTEACREQITQNIAQIVETEN